MPSASWLTCSKQDVQLVKSFLDGKGLLRHDDKVRPRQDGLMIIPVTTDDLTEVQEELNDLGGDDVRVVTPDFEHSVMSAIASNLGDVVREWLVESDETEEVKDELIRMCPKRWSTYPPMVLLPSGSFQDAGWTLLMRQVDMSTLWKQMLDFIGKREGNVTLTHLAINSGIPLSGKQVNEDTTDFPQNILRSPTGLTMLHGDFGPALPLDTTPSEKEFEEAFWVTTKQNGIWQTWAPRYTMFSRGNVKEKARVLGFHGDFRSDGTKQMVGERAAVDLYAGIGYFVFSYAAMGVGRIWGWEINPWSVEGLRRGACKNKWKVRVIRGFDLRDDWRKLVQSTDQIVVFEEGNEMALKRMGWQGDSSHINGPVDTNILHVNCGYLPSSRLTWKTALTTVSNSPQAWLHLHENVAVADIESRSKEIQAELESWAAAQGQTVEVEHVELVKTFAPGVWHCVFDVVVQRVGVDGGSGGG